MEWAKAVAATEDATRIPKSWLHLHYFETLNLLFRIENSLRVFTYVVLKSAFGSKWADTSIATEDDAAASQGSIASIGRKRMNQAKAFGYLGYVSPSPLLYLSMGEIVSLIFWLY